MAEVIFPGPEGRLEGHYRKAREDNAPVALILHPHPQFGGTMNDKITYEMYHMFARRGFGVMRFNFRGVGKSEGEYDQGQGELSDAATALDYLQQLNPTAPFAWVAGFSFGSYVGMQLLMRRPEIVGFLSISAAANLYDFSFLAPCPSSGLVLHGESDKICPPSLTKETMEKTRTQKGRKIEFEVIPGADHFFSQHQEALMEASAAYLDRRLEEPPEGRLFED
ncbi:alpha/beta hydrolase [Parvularcula sp. ZS-1/3]|uniref:Alpha/beta hydrolase n=1 Tax=Parvularcula mediterranea TaxID=2732508 RepID=A0A7Y3RP52_9PROT|nr:alpha/beta hydrolase [Parvularcula mediterranea]NNU17674.1 alpha/beta hydrolase [Parvularcula mediterranea]